MSGYRVRNWETFPMETLKNGTFSERDEDGSPTGWREYRKTSECGGQVVWYDDPRTGLAPGVSYDRAGAYCLFQVAAVKPNEAYRLTGQIRTQIESEGTLVFFQLAWLDVWGGLVLDVPNAPKGTVYMNSVNWTQDRFEAVAPPEATAVEVRLFISGKGDAWMRGMKLERC